MAPKKKQRAKTQTLSLRLDPKTRFVLEFMARIRGQSITMVVERAIKEAASKEVITSYDEGGFGHNEPFDKDWTHYWDPSEGIRTLKLISDSDYQTTYDEDELFAFVKAHWEFFYTEKNNFEPTRYYVDILWPSIDKYLEIWREKKSEDFWAAGEAMKSDLVTARIIPPTWPRYGTSSDNTLAVTDEIPF